MRYLVIILVLLFSYLPICSAATENNFTFISSIQEQRFQHLLSELRCLVCQNQSLADSNAPLAQDLKRDVLERLRFGYTDEEIKKYLVARYGEYILFKPSVNSATFILWLGPVIFLCGSLLILLISIKRQSIQPLENITL
jgi:cytochrome c-type biogenesis protein CcmH